MFILGNLTSTNFSKFGFLWFQSSVISLKPGLEHVIDKFLNFVLIFFIVSIIWGFIWPVMKFILFNWNWSKKIEIILLNKFKEFAKDVLSYDNEFDIKNALEVIA